MRGHCALWLVHQTSRIVSCVVLYIRHPRLTPSRFGHAGRDDGVRVVLLGDRLGSGKASKGSSAEGNGGKHGDGVREDCGVSAVCSARRPCFVRNALTVNVTLEEVMRRQRQTG